MFEENIQIELSRAEALVLFELLSNFTDKEKLEIEDHAEERVLWKICGLLEKVLTEPFLENYDELLKSARSRVRNK